MMKHLIQWLFPMFASPSDIDNFFAKRNVYIRSPFPEQEVNVPPEVLIYSALQFIHTIVLIYRIIGFMVWQGDNKLIYGDTLSIYGEEGARFASLLLIYSLAAGLAQLLFHLSVSRPHFPFWTRVFKFENLTYSSRSRYSLHLNWVDRIRFLTFRSYYLRFIQILEFITIFPIIAVSVPVLFHDGPLIIWSIWFWHNIRNAFTIMFLGVTLPSCLAIVYVYTTLRFSSVFIQLNSIKKQTTHTLRSHFRSQYKSSTESCFTARTSGSQLNNNHKFTPLSNGHEIPKRLVKLIQDYGELCWEIRKFNVFWKHYQLFTFFAGFSSICLLGFLTTATDIYLSLKITYSFIMTVAFIYCVAGPFLIGALMFHQAQRINKKFLILLRHINDVQSKSKILVSLEQLTIFRGFTLFDIFHFSNNGFAWMLLRLIRYLLLVFKRLGR